jgi:hypothetical protein
LFIVPGYRSYKAPLESRLNWCVKVSTKIWLFFFLR